VKRCYCGRMEWEWRYGLSWYLNKRLSRPEIPFDLFNLHFSVLEIKKKKFVLMLNAEQPNP